MGRRRAPRKPAFLSSTLPCPGCYRPPNLANLIEFKVITRGEKPSLAAPAGRLHLPVDGEDVPRGVLEPGDPARRPIAVDALLVLVEALVALELDALLGQVVDRGFHVIHGKVEDRVIRRCEVLLPVDQDRSIADVKLKQWLWRTDVELLDLESEGLAIESLRLLDV